MVQKDQYPIAMPATLRRTLPAVALLSLLLGGCLADDIDPEEAGPGGSDGSEEPGEPGVDTYTIGGSVEGLGTSLTAVLNDDETVDVSAEEAFTFDTELEEDEPYEVTLQANPDGHECEVENGTGTVSEDVSDVLIACELLPAENETLAARPTEATVDWDESGVESYDVYWSKDPDFDPELHASEDDIHVTTSVTPPHVIENLDPDTNYYVRVQSIAGVADELGPRLDTRTPVPGLLADVNDLHRTAEDRIFLATDPNQGIEFHKGYVARGLHVMDAITGEYRARPAVSSGTEVLDTFQNGDLLIGGPFQSLDGDDRFQALARIDSAGNPDPDWGPELDLEGSQHFSFVSVAAIDDERDAIYIAGDFELETSGGDPINNLAALDKETGALQDWPISIASIATMSVHGDTLYVGGGFNQVTKTDGGGTTDRDYLASFDLDDGRSLTDWDPEPSAEVDGLGVTGEGSDTVVVTSRLLTPDAQAWDTTGDELPDFLPDDVAQGAGPVFEGDSESLHIAGGFEINGGTQPVVEIAADGEIINYWDTPDTPFGMSLSRNDGEVYAMTWDGAPQVRITRLMEDGETEVTGKERFEDPDAIFFPTMEVHDGRIAIGANFHLVSAETGSAFSVLGPDLQWEDDWPEVKEWRARGLDVNDERIYVAGQFHEVEDQDGTHDRPHLFAVDRQDRTVVPSWPQDAPAPSLSGVRDIENGGVVAYGSPNDWGGDDDYTNIVELAEDGSLARDVPEPLEDGDQTNTQVSGLAEPYGPEHLYIVGTFDSIDTLSGDNESRDGLARLNLSDDDEITLESWGEDFSHDGRLGSVAYVAGVVGTVFVGGSGVTEVDDGSGDDKDRTNIAGLDRNDATLKDWDADLAFNGGSVRSLSNDGTNHLFISGGAEAYPDGTPIPLSAAVDPETGEKSRKIGHGEESFSTQGHHRSPSDDGVCMGLGDSSSDPIMHQEDRMRIGLVCYTADNELAW